MRFFIFSALLLLGVASAAPVSDSSESDQLTVTDDFFPDNFKIYESQHDIVKIFVPLNELNFNDDKSDEDSKSGEDSKSNENTISVTDITIFFVEDNDRLYVRKDGKVKKLLDNARDGDAPKVVSNIAFFATKDGIYKYNPDKNRAEKYGTVNDDLKSIACGNSTEYLYALTMDKNVYKVTEDGNKKVKIDDVKNAEQIIMDISNNLFYLDSDKKLFVVNEDGVREITGLPANSDKITLLKPLFVYENGIHLMIDNGVYTAYPNGTVETEAIELRLTKPITASSVETSLIQYHAIDKKIYEYNLLRIATSVILEGLEESLNFVRSLTDDIQTLATRSRTDFLNKAR